MASRIQGLALRTSRAFSTEKGTSTPSSSSVSSIRSRSRGQGIPSDLWTDDESATEPNDDPDKFFFLKNVQLTLNGTLIDQVKENYLNYK